MVEQVNPLQSTASKKESNNIHLPSIDVSFGSNSILYDSLHPLPDPLSNLIAALGRPSRSHTAGTMAQSQWYRKVNFPPAYRYAQRSYTRTHFHPLRGTGSTVYFIVILLPSGSMS
jgi:hypothetical protein